MRKLAIILILLLILPACAPLPQSGQDNTTAQPENETVTQPQKEAVVPIPVEIPTISLEEANALETEWETIEFNDVIKRFRGTKVISGYMVYGVKYGGQETELHFHLTEDSVDNKMPEYLKEAINRNYELQNIRLMVVQDDGVIRLVMGPILKRLQESNRGNPATIVVENMSLQSEGLADVIIKYMVETD